MWVLELVVSTAGLVVVANYGGHVILNGTYTKIIVNDAPETVWSQELSWWPSCATFLCRGRLGHSLC